MSTYVVRAKATVICHHKYTFFKITSKNEFLFLEDDRKVLSECKSKKIYINFDYDIEKKIG